MSRIPGGGGRPGSFTAAAERVGTSKQLVSRRIAALEARTGRATCSTAPRAGLSPTPPGPGLSGACARDRRRRRPGEMAISQQGGARPRGTLRVQPRRCPSAPCNWGRCCRLSSPTIPRSAWELDLSDRAVDLVGEGFDVALPHRRGGRVHAGGPAPGRAGAWSPAPSPRLPAARRHAAPAHPNCANHGCLLYGHGPHQPSGITCAQAAPWRWRSPAACTPTTAKCWCRPPLAGHGLVHLPAFLLDDCLADGRLVPVLEAFEPAPIAI